MQRHLKGWRKELVRKDPRDFIFKATRQMLDKLPDEVDFRSVDAPILDQGSVGRCFSGDTKVSLVNGAEVQIKDLVDKDPFWVYSYDHSTGKIVPGKATARKTRENAELVEVELDNGEKVKCTPDHRWMLRDGSYKEAKDLVAGTSLMPLYRKYDNSALIGYELVQQPNTGEWHFSHRQFVSSPRPKGRNYLVHHIDFNRLNNCPENLIWMNNKEHAAYHLSLCEKPFGGWNGSSAQIEHSRRLMQDRWDTNRDHQIEVCKINNKKVAEIVKANPIIFQKVLQNLEKGRSLESNLKKKNTLLKFWGKEENRLRQKLINEEIYSDLTLAQERIDIGRSSGKKSVKFRMLKWAKTLLDLGVSISKDTWDSNRIFHKPKGYPTFECAMTYFDTIENLQEKALTFNHKIVKITFVEKSDVYCLVVEQYHNFALTAGVFVHNCTGASSAGSHQFLQIKGNPKTVFLPSMDFPYYNARVIEGSQNEDAGATIRDVVASMVKVGITSEKIWPSTQPLVKPSIVAYQEALNHQVLKYQSIPQNLETMLACIAARYSMQFGVVLHRSFQGPATTKTGVVKMPSIFCDSVIGGHAMRAVGYSMKNKWFIVPNTWGLGFGDKGYCYFPFDYLLNPDLCSDIWQVMIVEEEV